MIRMEHVIAFALGAVVGAGGTAVGSSFSRARKLSNACDLVSCEQGVSQVINNRCYCIVPVIGG